MGDLSGWVGDRLGVGITSVFGVPEEMIMKKKGGVLCWKGAMCRICGQWEEWDRASQITSLYSLKSGWWVHGSDVVDGASRIRLEKSKEHQYREGYAKSLESEWGEWDGESNGEHIWEQVKQAMQQRCGNGIKIMYINILACIRVKGLKMSGSDR